MLVGYNTNVPYKGNMYHVQTEDNGVKNPVIVTLLYCKGTILASKKASYADIAESPDYKEKVRELMKEQHKSMMKELITGRYTDNPQEKQEEKSQPQPEKTVPQKNEPLRPEHQKTEPEAARKEENK